MKIDHYSEDIAVSLFKMKYLKYGVIIYAIFCLQDLIIIYFDCDTQSTKYDIYLLLRCLTEGFNLHGSVRLYSSNFI